MKQLSILTIALFATLCTFAQSEKYTAAMKKNLAAMDTAFKSPAGLLSLANSFERIATTEKNQWLPYYYAAFLQVNAGIIDQDKSKADAIADKATALLNVADSLSPNNSEISCIKSVIASCHMLVNPQERWMQYGQESATQLETAIQQDPTNPRPNFLKGQGLKYTPEQFGGGCATAKPELETALQKFNAFKPASDIAPNWGKQIVEQLLSDCK